MFNEDEQKHAITKNTAITATTESAIASGNFDANSDIAEVTNGERKRSDLHVDLTTSYAEL